jgi:hypothetical protein
MGGFRDTRDSDHRHLGIAFANPRERYAKIRIVGGKKKRVGSGPAPKILQMKFPDDFVRLFTQNLRQRTLQILWKSEQSDS